MTPSSGCWPRSSAALPADAITAWDMTILAYWAAPHLRDARRPAVPLSARFGHARLRVAGGDRREHRAPRPARAGRGRRRRPPVRAGRARHRRAARGARPSCWSSTTAATGSCANTSATRSARRPRSSCPAATWPPSRAAFGVPVRTAAPDDLAEQLGWALASRGRPRSCSAAQTRRRRADAMSATALREPAARRSVLGVGAVRARGQRGRDQGALRPRGHGSPELEREPVRPAARRARRGRRRAARRPGPTPRRPTRSCATRSPRWAGADPAEVVPGHGIQALTLALVGAFVEPGDAVVDPASHLRPLRPGVRGGRRRGAPGRQRAVAGPRPARRSPRPPREHRRQARLDLRSQQPDRAAAGRRPTGRRSWTRCPTAAWPSPTRPTATTSSPSSGSTGSPTSGPAGR